LQHHIGRPAASQNVGVAFFRDSWRKRPLGGFFQKQCRESGQVSPKNTAGAAQEGASGERQECHIPVFTPRF
jgi:hypothetical protein